MSDEVITAARLVARIESTTHGSGYYAVYGPQDSLEVISDEVLEECRWQQVNAARIPVEPLDGLMGRLRDLKATTAILIVTHSISNDFARLLEGSRSRLPLDKHVVLVLSQKSAATLQEDAPHFASFLAVLAPFQPETLPPMGEEEVERRLAALRSQFGKSDAEIIQRADRGDLPADPEFAEWLLLLGRTDLG